MSKQSSLDGFLKKPAKAPVKKSAPRVVTPPVGDGGKQSSIDGFLKKRTVPVRTITPRPPSPPRREQRQTSLYELPKVCISKKSFNHSTPEDIKELIEKISNTPPADRETLLTHLRYLDASMAHFKGARFIEMLKQTKDAGPKMRELRKNEDQEVATYAARMLKRWRELYESKGKTATSGRQIRADPIGKKTKPTPKDPKQMSLKELLAKVNQDDHDAKLKARAKQATPIDLLDDPEDARPPRRKQPAPIDLVDHPGVSSAAPRRKPPESINLLDD